jgi:hypothetical protein
MFELHFREADIQINSITIDLELSNGSLFGAILFIARVTRGRAVAEESK